MIDDAEIRRELNDLRAGRIGPIGDVTLGAAPAVSTTVTTRACSSTSFVALMKTTSGAPTQTIYGIVPGNGSFVIHHTADATPDTYRWAVFTPINRSA